MIELNMDGLVGPTHHYGGLANGNVASMDNAWSEANPKAAALQGLSKMRLLHEHGIPQAFFPPHARPHVPFIKQLGFEGPVKSIIGKLYDCSPQLLSAAFSASNMWSANTATITSYLDANDNRTHFTPANLITNIHRYIEAPFSAELLRLAFPESDSFCHHPILPQTTVMGDEGAANHCRLGYHDKTGTHLFVFGQQSLNQSRYVRPKRYWARQTLEASRQIAFNHRLDESKTVFACQNPDIVDQGVFHNDVVAVSNENLFLVHEYAYVDQDKVLSELRKKSNFDLKIYQVSNSDLSIADAVNTYLFNSQIITLPDNKGMLFIAPSECEQSDRARHLIEKWINDDNCPLNQVVFLDLKQSMRNGGGPACLRLRVPLNNNWANDIHQGFILTDNRLKLLEAWINKHYRDRLQLKDLCDPEFIDEIYFALDGLSQIMGINNLYPFQQ